MWPNLSKLFSALLTGWNPFDAAAVTMVLIGVVGGWLAAPHHNLPNAYEVVKARRRATMYEVILIAGLAMELFALPRHILETADLNDAAARATERASKAEETTESLRRQNLILEKEVLKQSPRTISEQRRRYGEQWLRRFSGTPVMIRWISQDADTDILAQNLRDLLTASDWKVNMDEGWLTVGEGIAISPAKEDDHTAAVALEMFLTGSGITAEYKGPNWAEPNPGTWSKDTNAVITVMIGHKGNRVRFFFGPYRSPGVSW